MCFKNQLADRFSCKDCNFKRTVLDKCLCFDIVNKVFNNFSLISILESTHLHPRQKRYTHLPLYDLKYWVLLPNIKPLKSLITAISFWLQTDMNQIF